MMRLAQDQGIELGNQFYWNACSCCGMLWVPITFTARLWTYRKLRSAAAAGCGSADGFIFLSKVMSGGEREKKRKKANYMVYRCGGCGRYSVFDNYPLEEEEVIMMTPTIKTTPTTKTTTTTKTTAEERRKMTQLQKILQRSKPTISSTNTNQSSSGLGDFLKGLNPKLDKK